LKFQRRVLRIGHAKRAGCNQCSSGFKQESFFHKNSKGVMDGFEISSSQTTSKIDAIMKPTNWPLVL
jgi:hypothetical protein